ncbi:MAG: pyridoxal phosphate-dependent aminotransferase [Clostridiales bacterium]|nr:pyridoxal phosphate-dependent aminotransferase [Clostridiales bacterium]
MKFDFDKIYDRHGTNSLKHDFFADNNKPSDVLPLWIADMDFHTPQEIINALNERTAHGIFGYSAPTSEYYRALEKWFLNRHDWKTEGERFIITSGVIPSICSMVHSVTEPGDSVIICQPVYYPFASIVKNNGRKLIVSQLKNNDGYYTFDYEDFERKIIENDVKAFILCNPHNPVGRVWTREELERIGDICLAHNVFVISDDIHADFAFGEHKHIVFSTIKKDYEAISAVCTAPTKTFNIAGLHIANTYIYDDEVRQKFSRDLMLNGYDQPNIMGLTACQTAYNCCSEWLDELKAYIWDNIMYVHDYLCNNIPDISMRAPEGTYLLWLDCRKLGLSAPELETFMLNKAKLWLDEGYIFGESGSGFERLNAASPRSILEEAMDRLHSAL